MPQRGLYTAHVGWTAPGSSSVGQIPLGASSASLSGTAAQHRVTSRGTAGDLKNFYVNVTTNAMTNATTVALRKNGSTGNLSVSVTAATTGVFSDLVGSDTIADGDNFNMTVSTGLSAGDIAFVASAEFETAGAFLFHPAGGAAAGSTVSTASTSFYGSPYGRLALNTTENTQRLAAVGDITIDKMQFYVSANGRSTSTTVVSRNNGADGNQTVTVTAASTGLFEDTTNSDSVADGNFFSIKHTLGTGTGNWTVRFNGFRITPAIQNGCPIYATSTGGYSVSAAGSLVTGFNFATAAIKTVVPFTAKASRLYADVSTNTVTAASTLTLRKGGSDTALVTTITASTTGRFVNTTNAVDLAAGDQIDTNTVAGSTGTTLTVRNYGMLVEARAIMPVFDHLYRTLRAA